MKNKKTEQKTKNIKGKKNNEKHFNSQEENEEDEIEEEYNPKLDPKTIISFDYYLDIVLDLKCIDLVFLIDSTASMNCYSKDINKKILKIIYDLEKSISKYFLEEIDILKIGIITYRDHEDEEKTYLTKIEIDLTNDIKEIKNIIKNITYSGGKDEPEAVLDGLNSVFNDISWREKSTKFLVHILDAPCHGKKYHNLNGDKIENCPKNLNTEEILDNLRKKGIEYFIVKINGTIDLMIQKFKNNIDIDVVKPEISMDKSKILKQD